MSSREEILKAIKANKPDPTPLPDLPDFARPEGALVSLFTEAAQGVGAHVWQIENGLQKPELWVPDLQKRYPQAQKIAHQIHGLGLPAIDESALRDPHQLADIDLAIIPGSLGVAENAAIWIPEEVLPQRVLPFITQHLVLVLSRQEIVWNMHEAYAQLGPVVPGFGVFISGPSKTADIEQSLVLGAHGARSLLIVLV